MSSGRPPTLWWLLMTAACAVPLSITSGYSVPWTRKRGVDQAAGVLLEDAHEQLADDLALLLGVGDPAEALEEALAGVDVDELDAQVAPERLDDLRRLALAHQPGVDVDAGQLGADGPVDERGGDRGVDPAGQAADGPAVADLGPHGLDLRVDDRRHRPRRAAAAHVEQEPGSAAPGRLGVCATSGWNWTPWIRRSACSSAATATSAVRAVATKPVGRPHDRVEVAHPHRLRPAGRRRAGRSPRP